MIWRHSLHVAQVRTESANRVALLHLDATQPVVLEGTAATIWDLIDGDRSEQDILAELEAVSRTRRADASPRSKRFLRQLWKPSA